METTMPQADSPEKTGRSNAFFTYLRSKPKQPCQHLTWAQLPDGLPVCYQCGEPITNDRPRANLLALQISDAWMWTKIVVAVTLSVIFLILASPYWIPRNAIERYRKLGSWRLVLKDIRKVPDEKSTLRVADRQLA